MFQRAKQQRVFHDIIDQIQEAILEGKITAGERLPSERKLKDMFQTSRGTLREALRVLEQKGLVEIKTGVNGGAVVKKVTPHLMSESLDLLIRSQQASLKDLAQFREGVEGIVTALAAKQATKEDIAALQTILNKAEKNSKAQNPDWATFVDTDNAFHIELARIAGNMIYTSVLKTVHDNIQRYYDSFLTRGKKIVLENYQDLCAIAKAVSDGDAALALVLAQNHVRQYGELMEKRKTIRLKKIKKTVR
jgi:DNA-binding FadR family transcriptional regulator